MSILKRYNTDTSQWEAIDSGAINDGSLRITPNQIGNLSNLTTTEKSNLVGAVSEVKDEVTSHLAENASEKINVKFPPSGMVAAKGDGVTDDTATLNTIFDYAREKKIKVIFPKGIYLISAQLNLGGVDIEGNESSIAESSGWTVIKCATKTFTALKQIYNSGDDITYNIKNIVIQNADVGLDIGTAFNCEFESIYFYDCNLPIQNGHNDISGPLFCTWINIYTDPTTCLHSMVIEGLQHNNNNQFINCAFYSIDWAIKINVDNGLGAVNNYFQLCEINSANSHGVDLGIQRNTKFENCYLECKSSPIVINGAGANLVLNDCVYGNLKNNNAQGYDSFIRFNAACTVKINGGWVYLPQSTETANLCLINGSDASYLNGCTIFKVPEVYGNPTNYKTSGQYADYANMEFTDVIVNGNSSPALAVKLQSETKGYEVLRNAVAGGVDYGMTFKFKNIEMYNFSADGSRIYFVKPLFPTDDIKFESNLKGVILKDKSNGNSYRLTVTNGVLGVEVV
jgi:hypothetical protein